MGYSTILSIIVYPCIYMPMLGQLCTIMQPDAVITVSNITRYHK